MIFLDKLIAVLQAFGHWLCFWALLEQEQIGFIRRFGRHARSLEPGLHWKAPFIERLEFEDARPYVYVLDPQSLRTADGIELVLRLTVTVTVTDVKSYFSGVFDGRQNVQDVAAGELGAAVRASSAADVFGEKVAQRVSRKLRAAAKGWGMHTSDVQFVDCAQAPSHRLWQTQSTSSGQE